ncbi:hypothetical protein CEE44_02240 [Candidatus Woesearchaeota archaeon B3_Woes]|nr:MAG: hypothetical protein CEE44_02240 [Candidatus Woesearchaeota archaeon B3_Woes]
MDKDRIVMFGLDCASYNIINQLIKENKLPNFGKIINNGCFGMLKSVEPVSSAPAWVSFMTGKNQGKHGIYAWFKTDPKLYNDRGKLLNAFDIDSKTIWEILGKKSGCINMPFTYPYFKTTKFMVSGFPRPSFEKAVYPKKLLKELKEYETEDLPSIKNKTEYLKKIYKNDEKVFNLFLYFLNKNKNLDFLCCVIDNLDKMSHHFWDDEKVLFNYYNHLDKKIGMLLNKLEKNDTLFILSDHGANATPTKKFYFNKWLKEKGLLKLENKQFFDFGYWMAKLRISKSSLEKVIYKLGLLRFVAKNISNQNKAKMENMLPPFSYIDWNQTKMYYTKTNAHSPYEGININSKGKKPKGIVDEKEYEKLRESMIAELKELKDPNTNKKIVEWVCKREELYKGKHTKERPDIILKLKEDYTGEIDIKNKLVENFKISIPGEHHVEGIFMAYGENIKKEFIKGAELIDVTPTILHMLNIPIPSDIDGKVLKIFDKDSDFEKRDVKINSKTDIEKEHINDILKDIKF